MASSNPNLKRQLSPLSVWAIAFGCIIGWGSFINPGEKFLPNSGVAGTAVAMLLGALVMTVFAFSYGYMVPKHPEAGGEFTYARSCFGRVQAFFCGWFLLAAVLTVVPMNSTAIPLIVDGLDGPLDLLKFGFHYRIAGCDVWLGEMLVSMLELALICGLNLAGIKKAGFVTTALTVILVSTTFILLAAALISPKAELANLAPLWGFDRQAALEAGSYRAGLAKTNIAGAVLATFAITPWAYVGFDAVPQAAEELSFSHKKVLGIMAASIAFGCFVYIANTTVAAVALANWPERVLAGDWVLLVAAEELLGGFGKVLVGTGVSCAVLASTMGFYFTASRVMYSMARDGYLPACFSVVDEKKGTPQNALLFCLLVSLSGPVLGRKALGWLVDMSSVGASVGYFFTCAACLRTQRRDGDGSPLLRALACLGTGFALLFIFIQLVPIPGLPDVHFCRQSYLMLLAWSGIGAVLALRARALAKPGKS